jgi:hypothetical protein
MLLHWKAPATALSWRHHEILHLLPDPKAARGANSNQLSAHGGKRSPNNSHALSDPAYIQSWLTGMDE